MKVKNDQFYTCPKIALKCISLIKNINTYDTIIEPSAGNGAFSDLIDKCEAYDIEPLKPSIQFQDFLKMDIKKHWGRRILFVGNPPFGKRSTLAKAFIRQAMALGATTIAFVLPDIFSKTSNQKFNLFPKEWRLIKEFKLPDDSFLIKEQNELKIYHVPCTFYIWTKDSGNLNLRRYPPQNKPKHFSFLPRGDQEADFVINGNSGKIKTLNQITNSKSEHYIKVNSNFSKNYIIRLMKQLVFIKKSSVNGGIFWINRNEIIEAWNALPQVREND